MCDYPASCIPSCGNSSLHSGNKDSFQSSLTPAL